MAESGSPEQYYKQKHEAFQKELEKRRKRKTGLGLIRFGNIVLMIIIGYFVWNFSILLSFILIISLIVLFFWIVRKDLDNKARMDTLQVYLKAVNQELLSLHGSYSQFPNGANWKPKDHRYAEDLDLFGPASLFQFLNRTNSEPGEKCLANWLLDAAPLSEILPRQQAVKELNEKPDFLLDLRVPGLKKKFSFMAERRLNEWLKEPTGFLQYGFLQVVRFIVPLIMLGILTLYIGDWVGLDVFIYSLLFSGAISYYINKKVSVIHNSLSFMVDELKVVTQQLMLIESATFNAEKLHQLQKKLSLQNHKASSRVKDLEKILSRFDLRYNMLLSAPLNLFLLWNLQQILDLEKWKTSTDVNLEDWIDAIAEMEALSSLATVCFNNPEWSFPEIVPAYFVCEGKNLGHPLIPKEKRVDNSISIPDNKHIMLITGSNMAGKSTYLRTIGVNTVLALAGSAVCADHLKISHVKLMSSMRIADNLEESTSTFYAELKKLKQIIDAANANEYVFVLLDEILRGTNSHDRHTGSRALIRQLLDKHAVALVATHDLALSEYARDFGSHISNYYFDVTVNGEDLSFDYRIKPGVCNSMNASILMKKIGIRLDDSDISN